MKDHYLPRVAKNARKNLSLLEGQLSGGAGHNSGV